MPPISTFIVNLSRGSCEEPLAAPTHLVLLPHSNIHTHILTPGLSASQGKGDHPGAGAHGLVQGGFSYYILNQVRSYTRAVLHRSKHGAGGSRGGRGGDGGSGGGGGSATSSCASSRASSPGLADTPGSSLAALTLPLPLPQPQQSAVDRVLPAWPQGGAAAGSSGRMSPGLGLGLGQGHDQHISGNAAVRGCGGI